MKRTLCLIRNFIIIAFPSILFFVDNAGPAKNEIKPIVRKSNPAKNFFYINQPATPIVSIK